MRVLVATDLSPAGGHALTLARAAPWPPGSQLRIVTVIEPPEVAPEVLERLDADALELSDRLAADLARAHLDAATAKFQIAGVGVETAVLVGRAADEIVGEARAFDAELVIVGSCGRGPFATTLLGAVAAEVVDRAPCPVLVARADTLSRLVVAEDGSQGAREAIRFLAAAQARELFSGLPARVVSVVERTIPWPLAHDRSGRSDAAVAAYARVHDQLRTAARRSAAASAAILTSAGVAAQAETCEGQPASEIVREAAETGADLIVLGSRGHTGLARLSLGSIAGSVLQHAPCSVLVVHQPPPEEDLQPDASAA